MWQMILPKDMQDTETHSGLMQETAVWRKLQGPFCVSSSCSHTHALTGGQRGKCLMIQRAPFHGLHHHHLCFGNKVQTCLPPRPSLLLRYNQGKLFTRTGILPSGKRLTREYLCLPRLPRATECHQCPMSPLWRGKQESYGHRHEK